MFKYYFNFKDLPLIGRVQISEPFGSDAQTHSIKQDDNRYGRDMILGNEETKLKIFRDNFEFMYYPQMSIDGVEFNHLSHAFDYLCSLFETIGWESEVEYIISKDDVDFNTGIIEFFTINIKDDFIEFSIIQNTKIELVKRRKDTYINAFNDKDLEGNSIIPCATSNILLKAKPINQTSSWVSNSEFAGGFAVVKSDNPIITESSPFNGRSVISGANNCNVVNTYEIDNTLSFIGNTFSLDSVGMPSDGLSFTYIEAVEELTNVFLSFTDVNAYTLQTKQDYFDNHVLSGSGYVKFIVKVGSEIHDPYMRSYILYEKNFGFVSSTPVENLPTTFNLEIPLIKRGERCWIFLQPYAEATFDTQVSGNLASYEVYAGMIGMKLTISATSTSINSVIKGVRIIDLIKHNVKSISRLNTESEMYDINGEYYNNFAFNGYLIARQNDVSFDNNFDDLINVTKELNADYQINNDKVEILRYDGFYRNIEIANFEEIANEENGVDFNQRYFIKQVNFKYNKSSFGRVNNEANSLDDIHTEAQYLYPTNKADGILNIELKHVRSAFIIEEQRKKITKDRKSLENDDTLFLMDVVNLPDNSRGNFTAILDYFEGKILSNNFFSWDLLGFEIGDVILVNNVSVVVLDIEPNLLTTTGSFGAGRGLLTIDYPLTNVDFVNRTNEGFLIINGVSNPSNYSNLNYHIKRNLLTYKSYLATASKYLPNKSIQNTVFRVNDKLETQLESEIYLTKDKADIVIDDIAHLKILNPIIHTITVYCDFNQATQLFKDIETIKGYIKVNTINGKKIKGFPKEAEYEWKTEKLNLVLEEKFEGDYMDIYKLGDTIFVTPIGFDTKIGLKAYNVYNNFVSLYNDKDILIANTLSFEYIKINNILYTNLIDFSNALDALI